MFSDPVSTNTSSPMDPLNRVPPFHHAIPDNQYGGSQGDRPGADVDEQAKEDEVAVDDMVRDLELELGGDSPEDNSLGGAARPDGIDSHGANEDDFATVGVRNLEWRLPIIRSAAHRSADAIASSQLVDPSESQEALLTKIVLSTYRLIDPRYRGSYFQQVRVGRMLPMALQTASRIDGTPPSLQPIAPKDQGNSVRLFGHPIPPQAIAPVAQPNQWAKNPRRLAPKKKRRRQRRQASASSNERAEAIEVLAELQSRSYRSSWPSWFHRPGVAPTLIGLAVLFMLGIVTYQIVAPRQKPIEPREHLVSNRKAERSVDQTPVPVAPVTPPLRPLPPVSRPVEAPAPARETDVSPRVTAATEPTLLHPSLPELRDPDLEIAPSSIVPEITRHELTTEELMAALGKVAKVPNAEVPDVEVPNVEVPDVEVPDVEVPDVEVPDVEVPDVEVPDVEVPDVEVPDVPMPDVGNTERSTPMAPAGNPPATTPGFEDVLNAAGNAGMTAPNQLDIPSTLRVRNREPLDEAVITAAITTLWSETESASRRFTDSTAAELIDAWDLIAELAGTGSAENAAATRLIRQASWLIYPFSKIVAQLRKTDASISARFVNASDSTLGNTLNLNADEIKKLFLSWRAARKRVARTSDLNQMLRQGNVLLDRIVISDQLSPHDRSDFLAAFRIDVEQLAKICSDQDAISEMRNLFAAINTLPTPNEWERLASAEHPSGLMASIYCLQQRRWDQGIAWLGQTSNLPVAAAAKAEWKLIESEQLEVASGQTDSTARASLANRWSKIADRLEPCEAAAVRRHAIDLYGNAPETATQRNELRAQLPQYLE